MSERPIRCIQDHKKKCPPDCPLVGVANLMPERVFDAFRTEGLLRTMTDIEATFYAARMLDRWNKNRLSFADDQVIAQAIREYLEEMGTDTSVCKNNTA